MDSVIFRTTKKLRRGSEDLAVVVVDFLHALSQAVMAWLDGIIGYNFLKQFRVTIDYPNETLSFD